MDYNRFLYVRGNPLKFSDPSGHLTEDEIRKYFGYEGQDKDALLESMLQDGWSDNLAEWLFNPETGFGEVFTYYDEDGGIVGAAMLVLFETDSRSRQYRGGFYGLTGSALGMEVNRNSIHSFSDDTSTATHLEALYQNAYETLPRKTGTDYRNYYDPARYKDWRNLSTVSFTAGVAGASQGLGSISAGQCSDRWTCAASLVLSVVGLSSPPEPTSYPVLLQPNTGGIGNPPEFARWGPPRN